MGRDLVGGAELEGAARGCQEVKLVGPVRHLPHQRRGRNKYV